MACRSLKQAHPCDHRSLFALSKDGQDCGMIAGQGSPRIEEMTSE